MLHNPDSGMAPWLRSPALDTVRTEPPWPTTRAGAGVNITVSSAQITGYSDQITNTPPAIIPTEKKDIHHYVERCAPCHSGSFSVLSNWECSSLARALSDGRAGSGDGGCVAMWPVFASLPAAEESLAWQSEWGLYCQPDCAVLHVTCVELRHHQDCHSDQEDCPFPALSDAKRAADPRSPLKQTQDGYLKWRQDSCRDRLI